MTDEDPMTEEDIQDMEGVIESMEGGAVIELLDPFEKSNIAIGISVGVDAAANRDYKIAAIVFEKVAEMIREEYL